MRHFTKFAALAAATAILALAGAGSANAAGATSTPSSGSGTYSNDWGHGDYSWTTTTVTNKSWNKIITSELTVHGVYGWTQVFSVTEKQAKPDDRFTVTGTVTNTNPWVSGSTTISQFTIGTTADVPWEGIRGDQLTPVPVGAPGVTRVLGDAEWQMVLSGIAPQDYLLGGW